MKNRKGYFGRVGARHSGAEDAVAVAWEESGKNMDGNGPGNRI